MKSSLIIRSAVLMLLIGLPPTTLLAAGPLTPPGAPAPTMKTLQEIWDEIGTLKMKVMDLQQQLSEVQGEVTIEMVTVGNAGNAADTTGAPNPAGEVGYEYKIGKYEVSNAEYSAFLNAVAATDTHSLYNSNMASSSFGGITQAGASPNFTYAVKANMGSRPVNFVNWYDCLRFCNWLNNGQPRGLQDGTTTEDGAYTLTGATTVATGTAAAPHGANGRNAGALFHLPGEDEWYKAAYHEPGASTNSYWFYPTRSDSAPTKATADLFGNINNDTASPPGIANYDFIVGNVTTVGSGGSGSESFYGAADMAGNLWEWNEQIISGGRGRRGGSFSNDASFLQATTRVAAWGPLNEGPLDGFRVAGPQ